LINSRLKKIWWKSNSKVMTSTKIWWANFSSLYYLDDFFFFMPGNRFLRELGFFLFFFIQPYLIIYLITYNNIDLSIFTFILNSWHKAIPNLFYLIDSNSLFSNDLLYLIPQSHWAYTTNIYFYMGYSQYIDLGSLLTYMILSIPISRALLYLHTT